MYLQAVIVVSNCTMVYSLHAALTNSLKDSETLNLLSIQNHLPLFAEEIFKFF